MDGTAKVEGYFHQRLQRGSRRRRFCLAARAQLSPKTISSAETCAQCWGLSRRGELSRPGGGRFQPSGVLARRRRLLTGPIEAKIRSTIRIADSDTRRIAPELV